ncbi:hypothetical protein HYV50_05855 [Candidatus Pacearchaeota archaeon]|nr:hypothetical protein [Candidatus Pacearchaeota archaeon]
MKRGLINLAFLFLFLLLVKEASAISLNIKEVYQPKETIIGELSGNILQPISRSQVKVMKGNVETPVDYDIKKLEEKYYIWIVSPITEGNYTVVVENVATIVQGRQEIINYEKSFSVSGNLVDYYIKPGAIFTTQNFEIIAVLYEDSEKIIDTDFPNSRQIVLMPGNNIIKFSIVNVAGNQKLNINLGKYTVPAYVKGKESSGNVSCSGNETNCFDGIDNDCDGFIDREDGECFDVNGTAVNESFGNGSITKKIVLFKFRPEVIRSTVLIDEPFDYRFQIVNLGTAKIENLILEYDKDKFIVEPAENISIEENSTADFNLKIKNYSGTRVRSAVIALYGGKYESMLLTINFTRNESVVSTDYLGGNLSGPVYYCSELSGTLCSENEVCEGQKISTVDGANNKCCIGSCESKTKSKAWIGYLIAAIVILVLFFIYSKYKKTRPSTNPIQDKAISLGFGKGAP